MENDEFHQIKANFAAWTTFGLSAKEALEQLAKSLNKAASPIYQFAPIYENRGVVYRRRQPYLVLSRRAW